MVCLEAHNQLALARMRAQIEPSRRRNGDKLARCLLGSQPILAGRDLARLHGEAAQPAQPSGFVEPDCDKSLTQRAIRPRITTTQEEAPEAAPERQGPDMKQLWKAPGIDYSKSIGPEELLEKLTVYIRESKKSELQRDDVRGMCCAMFRNHCFNEPPDMALRNMMLMVGMYDSALAQLTQQALQAPGAKITPAEVVDALLRLLWPEASPSSMQRTSLTQITTTPKMQRDLLESVLACLHQGVPFELCLKLLCPSRGKPPCSMQELRRMVAEILPEFRPPRETRFIFRVQAREFLEALREREFTYSIPLEVFEKAANGTNAKLRLHRSPEGEYLVLPVEEEALPEPALPATTRARNLASSYALWRALPVRREGTAHDPQFPSVPDLTGMSPLSAEDVRIACSLTKITSERSAEILLEELNAFILGPGFDREDCLRKLAGYGSERGLSPAIVISKAREMYPGLSSYLRHKEEDQPMDNALDYATMSWSDLNNLLIPYLKSSPVRAKERDAQPPVSAKGRDSLPRRIIAALVGKFRALLGKLWPRR